MARHYPTHTHIGQLMSALGWTATDFAASTGIHPRTLTDILAGRRVPSRDQLESMADVLDVEVAALVD
jgi:transcriptional regulator with XRE-family HTH domain